MNYFENYRDRLIQSLGGLDLEHIRQAAGWLREARDRDRQVLVCGNGGSAFTASHLATDLVKGASYGRATRFRVIALTDSIGTLTAYANDVGYDVVFEQQLRNYARSGDVLIAISGSGRSPNVVRAAECARELGCRTIGLTGRGGGPLGERVDLNIVSPESHMGRIEDAHMIVCHMLGYAFMDDAAV